MSDSHTPLKDHQKHRHFEQQTTVKKLNTSKKTSKYNSSRQKYQGGKNHPKGRKVYKFHAIKPSDYQLQMMIREKHHYQQSSRRQRLMERQRILSLPKNVARIKRDRARSYDQKRKEQQLLEKNIIYVPFKPDHPWNRPNPQQKTYYIDPVCRKHLQSTKTDYEQLSKKIKKYAKKAQNKVLKQKRQKRRKRNHLLKNLQDLEIEQEMIRASSRKKKLRRSNSEIAKAFT